MTNPSYITFRKHTFLSSLALGLSAIVIVLLISCTVVALYVVHLASEKTERVVALAQDAVRGLPEFTKSLPPALSDMLDDHRDPQYCHELSIAARLIHEPTSHGGVRTTIEITNNGGAVVSLLSLRILILDDQDQILSESQEWAATPVAADDGWRGPIMPGSTRRFICRGGYMWGMDPAEAHNAQVEVTELRVWNDTANQSAPADGATASVSGPVDPESEG